MISATSSVKDPNQLSASRARKTLTRVVAISLLIGLALAVLVLVLLVWFIGWGDSKPPVRVVMSGSSAEVHVETLGEYGTAIARARLQDLQSDSTVWEIKAETGTPHIWRLGFKAGDNPVLLVSPAGGTYKVIFPVGTDHFRLERGVEYELNLWKDPDSIPARAKMKF